MPLLVNGLAGYIYYYCFSFLLEFWHPFPKIVCARMTAPLANPLPRHWTHYRRVSLWSAPQTKQSPFMEPEFDSCSQKEIIITENNRDCLPSRPLIGATSERQPLIKIILGSLRWSGIIIVQKLASFAPRGHILITMSNAFYDHPPPTFV